MKEPLIIILIFILELSILVFRRRDIFYGKIKLNGKFGFIVDDEGKGN